MESRHFDGWLPDVARASIAAILYVGGFWVGLSRSFFYGGGFAGAFPFLLILVTAPWAAAWVAIKIVPSSRRLFVRLACGVYAGLLLFWLGGGALASMLEHPWRLGDPPPRFIEHEEAVLFVVALLLCVLAGGLAFSRWRSVAQR